MELFTKIHVFLNYFGHVCKLYIFGFQLLLSGLAVRHIVHTYDALHGVLSVYGTSTLLHNHGVLWQHCPYGGNDKE
jgi:hypothetical protein